MKNFIKRSTQTQYLTTPKPSEQVLALQLECGFCKTIRVYVIKETMKLLTDRVSNLAKFEAQCTVCQHFISASFGWSDLKPGYTFRKLESTGELQSVDDEMGLMESPEEK